MRQQVETLKQKLLSLEIKYSVRLVCVGHAGNVTEQGKCQVYVLCLVPSVNWLLENLHRYLKTKNGVNQEVLSWFFNFNFPPMMFCFTY